jgi:hypothetical protein
LVFNQSLDKIKFQESLQKIIFYNYKNDTLRNNIKLEEIHIYTLDAFIINLSIVIKTYFQKN